MQYGIITQLVPLVCSTLSAATTSLRGRLTINLGSTMLKAVTGLTKEVVYATENKIRAGLIRVRPEKIRAGIIRVLCKFFRYGFFRHGIVRVL